MRIPSFPLGTAALALVACITPALTAHAAPPQLRLDDAARPTRYVARLRVNPAEPTFSGAIDIDLKINRASDTLWLNATGLTIDKASFTVGDVTLAARVVPGNEDFVGFAVTPALQPGAARLHIEWKGNLSRKEDRGLFAQKEGERWYALTQFETIFARRVFPCFDEPNIKVPWQLTLEVPRALVALSNTSAVEGKSEHDGHEEGDLRGRRRPCPATSSRSPSGPTSSSTPGWPGRRRSPCASPPRRVAPRTPSGPPATPQSWSSCSRSTSASRFPTTSSITSPFPSRRPSAPWRIRAW